MPPRNPELPEGTDHIINGAMETSGTAADDAGTGFIASRRDDDTGGTRSGGTNMAGNEGNQDDVDDGVLGQLKNQASSLREQAGGRAREFAETSKTRATEALEQVSRVVSDAADSIEERLGSEYGEYARRAADTVSDLADRLRNKEVDELYEDARSAVRKSPGVAIAAAAVVGFALIRLVKAGLPPSDSDEGDSAKARSSSSRPGA